MPNASGRVVNHEAPPTDALEYDEMVQIPVQDARRYELWELVQLEPQRAGRQAERVCGTHEILEGRALLRHAEAAAQLYQTHTAPVIPDDHREAGEAALRSLGLQHHRQPRPPARVKRI
ncbi:MAG TPA: hypothetical protein VLS89_03175 [Candidatus Nanopelagicales bacterium]|nr:hypothetical protein [Candidatus Nanopelagicales bacterium]